jgi:hypothetical protein
LDEIPHERKKGRVKLERDPLADPDHDNSKNRTGGSSRSSTTNTANKTTTAAASKRRVVPTEITIENEEIHARRPRIATTVVPSATVVMVDCTALEQQPLLG